MVEQSPTTAHDPDHRGRLRSPSFIGLLFTQLFGAANDNAFRLLVIGICTAKLRPEYSSVILSAGLACFTLPYLLLAAPAGFLADRFGKRNVIIVCKAAEIAIMSAAIGAIYVGSVPLVLLILFLMGSQSALFSPAKYGSIPEMLHSDRISAANGLMGLVTIAATVLGVIVGNSLYDSKPAPTPSVRAVLDAAGDVAPENRRTLLHALVVTDIAQRQQRQQVAAGDSRHNLWLSAAVLIGLAGLGTAASFGIRPLPPANPARKFPWDMARETWHDLRALGENRALLRVALGIAFFWMLGALAQSNILEFGAESGMRQIETNPLLAALVIGVGLGSVLAGLLSGGRVELGMLPLGAAGIAIGAMALFSVSPHLTSPDEAWTTSKIFACFWLFVLGASAGMFDVPLEAFLQHRSPRVRRGSILAASNFLSFTGILIAAGAYLLLRAPVIEPTADVGPAVDTLPAEQRTHIAHAQQQLLDQWARLGEYKSADRPKLRDYRPEFSDPQDVELIRAVLGEKAPLFSARQVFLIAGALTIPILVYILWLIPDATLRFVVWLASKTLYRIRVYGQENLPEQGGALLVANHVSWLDGVLLMLVASRPIRMIANRQFVSGWCIGWMARRMQVIPLSPGRKSSVRETIETARQALKNGELVCIFPEGGITRTGRLQPFKRGMLAITKGTSVPIIPVFLDELWGSIFSFEGGRFFWKLPRRWPYPVSIHFGPPLPTEGDSGPLDVVDVRRAVEELGNQAVVQRMSQEALPPRAFVRNCRTRKRKLQVVDTLGTRLTGGQLLLRTLVLRRLLLRHVLLPDEKYVGILIPPSAGGVVVNAVMPLMGRVGVNLNYTLSPAEMDHCIRECGIRHVLTTRQVVERLREKFPLEIRGAELVYLDDLREKVSLSDKLSAAFMAKCLPVGMLERRLNIHKIQPDDVLTVIFTSGSTGMPKGVMLTHRNVGSNVAAIDQLIRLRDNDVIAGTLPLFHSLGYTITMWSVLMLGPVGAYHVSPLDYKIVGKLCKEAKATILITTPTFLRGYLKRCQPEDFVTLDVVVAGAEKLPVSLCDAFEAKFGVRPVEGYGTTELSPLVSANIPPDRLAGDEVRLREGSVGRPVPGVEACVVDPETFADLPTGQEGMLLVRGPNVMKGYLNHPEKTADVIRRGWYVTGDIAQIDEDGFIFITGRLSRFSKIGGEMVPHGRIEEELQRILGKDDEIKAAVTAVPDEAKGERLIVLHLPMDKTPDQVRKELAAAGLPNLFIPATDSFCRVDEIPLLGSGKLDLKRLKKVALEKFK
jgi:acyl-[acyl-carrier-protein]-phospholipid O-acyltransferase/long-chain-fatty-acid--[acyl-carrier-protein] ligase